MHALIRLAAVTAAVAGLSACAGTEHKAAYVAPHRVGDVVQDDAYVAYVERVARRRGIDVTWVNPPDRRVNDGAADRR